MVVSPLEWKDDFDKTTFRVVTDKDWKRGIRLENFYWSYLSELARSSDLRIGRYVHNLLPDGSKYLNATSRLRLHVLHALSENLHDVHKLLDPHRVFNVLGHCNTPYFAIDQRRRLAGYNRQFESYVRDKIITGIKESDRQSSDVMSSVRLTLSLPIDQIVEGLKRDSGTSIDCSFVIAADKVRHTGRSRVCLLEAADGALVISYVIS